jgi:SAM-dependent methyltransferase
MTENLKPSARQSHWEGVYGAKGENEVSWFQESPEPSLTLITELGLDSASPIIDIGGGASRLVDALLAKGFRALTVLDLSAKALAASRARLQAPENSVIWVAADVTQWSPSRQYRLWHDRAAFHFLTDPADRAAYVSRLADALMQGGYAIIATFAPDGPDRCSGLPIVRYDSEGLALTLGKRFSLLSTRQHRHLTPWGSEQRFQFSLFERV